MPKIVRTKRASRYLERDIQARIRLALGREPDLVLWRNAQVFAEFGDGAKARGGLGSGSSDLVGILRIKFFEDRAAIAEGRHFATGRFFGLEIKRPGNKPSPEQEQWLALVRRFGGFATWVDSEEAAFAALVRARRGEDQ